VATQTRDCPSVSLNITDPDFNADPFPVLEEWRALGPVVYNDWHDRYMVFSYRHCAKVLGDVTKFNSQGNVERFTKVFGGITMESLDSPRHHQMRGVWAPYFRRDTLLDQQQMIGEVVDSQIGPFVERLRAGEAADAIANMVRGIPTLVIAHMLGIDKSMFRQFSAWSDAMGGTTTASHDPGPEGRRRVAEGLAATAALNEYIAGELAVRRAGTGEDLISVMVHDDFADEMEPQEIIASNTQLVFAGNETTAKLMGSTLVALARYPEQRRALVADRSLIPQAFEEVHRYSTLTQTVPRHVCADGVSVAEVPLPNGAEMMPMLGAANRDATRWDRPHEFDIFRQPKQHLGFGFGMHVCLGLNLARLEARIWLDRLLDVLPDFELAGEIDYGRNFGVRGPLAVPLAAS
jgi:cytochrome P450